MRQTNTLNITKILRKRITDSRNKCN